MCGEHSDEQFPCFSPSIPVPCSEASFFLSFAWLPGPPAVVSISSRFLRSLCSQLVRGRVCTADPLPCGYKASWWGNGWICGSAPGLFLLLGFSAFCDIDVVAHSQSCCSSSLMWMWDSLPLNPAASVLSVLFSNTSLRLTDWTSCHRDCLYLCRR